MKLYIGEKYTTELHKKIHIKYTKSMDKTVYKSHYGSKILQLIYRVLWHGFDESDRPSDPHSWITCCI